MGINFPNTPAVGTVWPSPLVVGQPQYTWDGEKWVAGSINSTGAVRYDIAQTLSDAQTLQARTNIAVAPIAAMQEANLAVNGGLFVTQMTPANTTGVMTSGTLHTFADVIHQLYSHASAVITGYNASTAGASPGILPPVGFTNCIAMYGGTAPSVLANGDSVVFHQKIEGTRWAKLGWSTAAAKPITIAFMFYTNDPGIGFVRIANAAQDRFYYAEFNAPINGWNFVTMIIPGDSAASVWQVNNTTAAYINIYAAGKSAAPVVPNAWGAVGALQTTNSQNLIRSNTTTIALAGIVILPGVVTIPNQAALSLLMRPYADELRLVQRYLYCELQPSWIVVEGITLGVGTGRLYWSASFPVTMRASPTITLPTFNLLNLQPVALSGVTPWGYSMNGVHNAAINSRCSFNWSASAIVADARMS